MVYRAKIEPKMPEGTDMLVIKARCCLVTCERSALLQC
jgi:hypothetical protein